MESQQAGLEAYEYMLHDAPYRLEVGTVSNCGCLRKKNISPKKIVAELEMLIHTLLAGNKPLVYFLEV